MVNCDECGEPLQTHHAAKDHGRWVYCRKCGLVVDDNPMGSGISGLMAWLRIYNATKSQMRKITSIYVNGNLRGARLAAIEIIEEDDDNDD